MGTTPDLRQAAQQALDNICSAKLCEINNMSSRHEMVRLMDKAIAVLEAALAAPQLEPVAWRPSWCRDVLQSGCGWFFGAPTKADIEYQRKVGSKIDYAYAHLAPADPPQRQPLSDEQIDALELPESGTGTIRDLVRVVEKAHNIGGAP